MHRLVKQKLDPGRAEKFLDAIKAHSQFDKEVILLKCHISALEDEISKLKEQLYECSKKNPQSFDWGSR